MSTLALYTRNLVTFFCLAALVVCNFSVASAATDQTAQKSSASQKAPVAQKAPAAKPQPKAQPKVTPKQNAQKKTQSAKPAAAKQTTAKQAAKPASDAKATTAHDKVQTELEAFAKDCIIRMNRQRRPGVTHKEVKRQSDGTFIARYMAVDPSSLATSYNPTANNKTIKFIGRMDYHEVEYVCVGKDQKQALAGPFNETNRTPITELIKFKSGKWSY